MIPNHHFQPAPMDPCQPHINRQMPQNFPCQSTTNYQCANANYLFQCNAMAMNQQQQLVSAPPRYVFQQTIQQYQQQPQLHPPTYQQPAVNMPATNSTVHYGQQQQHRQFYPTPYSQSGCKNQMATAALSHSPATQQSQLHHTTYQQAATTVNYTLPPNQFFPAQPPPPQISAYQNTQQQPYQCQPGSQHFPFSSVQPPPMSSAGGMQQLQFFGNNQANRFTVPPYQQVQRLQAVRNNNNAYYSCQQGPPPNNPIQQPQIFTSSQLQFPVAPSVQFMPPLPSVIVPTPQSQQCFVHGAQVTTAISHQQVAAFAALPPSLPNIPLVGDGGHLAVDDQEQPFEYNEDVLTTDRYDECAICLVEMSAGDVIARLPCLCVYHKFCIDEWLTRKKMCPLHPNYD